MILRKLQYDLMTVTIFSNYFITIYIQHRWNKWCSVCVNVHVDYARDNHLNFLYQIFYVLSCVLSGSMHHVLCLVLSWRGMSYILPCVEDFVMSCVLNPCPVSCLVCKNNVLTTTLSVCDIIIDVNHVYKN